MSAMHFHVSCYAYSINNKSGKEKQQVLMNRVLRAGAMVCQTDFIDADRPERFWQWDKIS